MKKLLLILATHCLFYGLMAVYITFTPLYSQIKLNSEELFWEDYQTILKEILVENNFESDYGLFSHNSVDYKKYSQEKTLYQLEQQQLEKLKDLTKPPRFDAQNDQEVKKYLAFWINVYNFSTLQQIRLQMGKEAVESMKDIGWKQKIINVGGKLYNLDEVEHKQIRLTGDPRIHFVVNCASVSCPTLHKQAFISTTIEEVLDQLVKEAFRNPLHLRIDEGYFSPSLDTTKLFRWYKEDWGSSKDVLSFLKKYMPTEYASFNDYSTGISYNWDINNRKNIDKAFEELNSEGYRVTKHDSIK